MIPELRSSSPFRLYSPVPVDASALSPFLDAEVTLGKVQQHSNPSDSEPRAEVLPQTTIQELIKKVLQELQVQKIADRCQVCFGGSFVRHLLVAASPVCNDADLKISVLQKDGSEDLMTLASQVEKAVIDALHSFSQPSASSNIRDLTLKCVRPFLCGTHALATSTLNMRPPRSEKQMFLEISIQAMRNTELPKYILSSDSFFIPFELEEGMLASPDPSGHKEPSKFWMYSYADDCQTVLENVRNGAISSPHSIPDAWFRLLKELSLSGLQSIHTEYESAYARAKKSLERLDGFIHRKKLQEYQLPILANAAFYDQDFIDLFCQTMQNDASRFPPDHWLSSFSACLSQTSSTDKIFLLKCLLPFFASELSSCIYVGKPHWKGKFFFTQSPSYIFIPSWQEGEEELFASFLPEIQAHIPPSLLFGQMKTLPPDFMSHVASLIGRISFQSPKHWAIAERLVQRCLDLSPEGKRKSDFLLECIRSVCKVYEGSFEKAPPCVWAFFKHFSIAGKRASWQTLFLKDLLPQLPENPSEELQIFIESLFESLYRDCPLFSSSFLEIPPSPASIALIQRLASKHPDPLKFASSLEALIKKNEQNKALHLLQYQSMIQSPSFLFAAGKKLLHSSLGIKERQTFNHLYQSLISELLQKAKTRNEKVLLALLAYKDLYASRDIARNLETQVFALPDFQDPLFKSLQKDPALQASFSKAFRSRFNAETSGPDADLQQASLALELLSKTSSPDLDLSEPLQKLLQKPGSLPLLWGKFPLSMLLKGMHCLEKREDKLSAFLGISLYASSLEEVKACLFQIFLFSQDFLERTSQDIEEIAKGLLHELPPQEKLVFAKECALHPDQPIYRSLFKLSFPLESERKSIFKRVSWGWKTLESFWQMFLEQKAPDENPQEMADLLLAQTLKQNLLSAEAFSFLSKLLPFLGKQAQDTLFQAIAHAIPLKTLKREKKQDLYRGCSLLLEDGLFGKLSQKNAEPASQVKQIKEHLFSNLPEKRQRLETLQNNPLQSSPEELAFLTKLFKQVDKASLTDKTLMPRLAPPPLEVSIPWEELILLGSSLLGVGNYLFGNKRSLTYTVLENTSVLGTIFGESLLLSKAEQKPVASIASQTVFRIIRHYFSHLDPMVSYLSPFLDGLICSKIFLDRKAELLNHWYTYPKISSDLQWKFYTKAVIQAWNGLYSLSFNNSWILSFFFPRITSSRNITDIDRLLSFQSTLPPIPSLDQVFVPQTMQVFEKMFCYAFDPLCQETALATQKGTPANLTAFSERINLDLKSLNASIQLLPPGEKQSRAQKYQSFLEKITVLLTNGEVLRSGILNRPSYAHECTIFPTFCNFLINNPEIRSAPPVFLKTMLSDYCNDLSKEASIAPSFFNSQERAVKACEALQSARESLFQKIDLQVPFYLPYGNR